MSAPTIDVSDSRQADNEQLSEQSVLGAMLLNTSAVGSVSAILNPEDFALPAHRQIYRAILDTYNHHGDHVDALTVAETLSTSGQLSTIGGAGYLHTLTATVPIPDAAAYYAAIVSQHAQWRRLSETGTRLLNTATARAGDINTAIDTAQTGLLNALGRTQSRTVSAADLLPETLTTLETIADGSLPGIPTGYADVDRLISGLRPGQLIVIGARPAQGKSTVGVDWARHAALNLGQPAAIFSLEMSATEILTRILSTTARVPLHNMTTGTMDSAQWQRVHEATARLSTAPLFIDDTATTTVTDIRAKCRRLQQTHGLRLAVVDYLQLLTSSNKIERHVAVSEFTRNLKLLSKDLDMAVVAISQLNRNNETAARAPRLSDLRESGSIEQDADLVFLLHRVDGDPDVTLHVAKHRNGPTAHITMAWRTHYATISDMAAD